VLQHQVQIKTFYLAVLPTFAEVVTGRKRREKQWLAVGNPSGLWRAVTLKASVHLE
jgi:hypothetical protein